MAGYANDYSKSNNALAAERDGKYPITHAVKIAAKRYGITQKQAREYLKDAGPCEWHHTSCKYNTTDYYEVSDVEPYIKGASARKAIGLDTEDIDAMLECDERAVIVNFEAVAEKLNVDTEILKNAYYF